MLLVQVYKQLTSETDKRQQTTPQMVITIHCELLVPVSSVLLYCTVRGFTTCMGMEKYPKFASTALDTPPFRHQMPLRSSFGQTITLSSAGWSAISTRVRAPEIRESQTEFFCIHDRETDRSCGFGVTCYVHGVCPPPGITFPYCTATVNKT